MIAPIGSATSPHSAIATSQITGIAVVAAKPNGNGSPLKAWVAKMPAT